MPKVKSGESKQKFLKRCTPMVIGEGKDASQAYAVCNSIWDSSRDGKAGLSDEYENKEMLLFENNESVKLEKSNDTEVTKRTFTATAYAGQIVDRWWSQLVIDVEGMQPKKNSIPALRNHDTDRIVGQSTLIWKDTSHFYVTGDMSNSTQDSKEVIGLADEGFPWQMSVRATALRKEVLEDEKQTAEVNGMTVKGPIEIWRETLISEVSFVPFGADDRTAGIVMSDEDLHAEIKKVITNEKGENFMDKLIEDLLKDERYSFTEDDRATLELLSEDALKKMLEVPVAVSDEEALAAKDKEIETLRATAESLKTDLQNTNEVLKQEQEARMTAEVSTEMSETGVPGELEDLTNTMLKLKRMDDEIYSEVLEILKGAGTALKAAGTFKEHGTNTDESSSFEKSSDVYNKLQELKQEKLAENPDMKEFDAWRQVTREHSKLYKEYNDLREKESSKVRDDDIE